MQSTQENPRFQPSFLVYLQCRNQSRRNLHAERRTAELFMLNLLNLLSNLRQDLQSSDFKLLRQWNRLGTWEVNYPYLKRNMGPFSGQILFAATDLEARPEATSKLVWKKKWKLKVGIFSERCKYPGSHCLWGRIPMHTSSVYIVCILDLRPDFQFRRWFVGLLSRLKTIMLGPHRATTWLLSQLWMSRQCFPDESKSSVHVHIPLMQFFSL